MPASLLMTARDELSPALNTVRNTCQTLNKSLQSLQLGTQNLASKESKLRDIYSKAQTVLDGRSSALRKATQEYKKHNDEISRTNLDEAHKEYNKQKQIVKDLGDEVTRTHKEYRSLQDEISRASNRVDGGGGGNGAGGEANLAGALGKAGLGKMLGDSLAGMAGTMITSAYGEMTGNAISSIVSGAAGGAAIGSMIAPGPGTAIGAAVGTLAGGINAVTAIIQEEDDIFRSEVQNLIAAVQANMVNSLTSGIELQGQWAGNLLSFDALIGEGSEEFLDELRQMDVENPFDLAGLTTQARLLLVSGLSEEDTLRTLGGIGNAAVIAKMDTTDMNQIAETLGYLGNLSTLNKLQANIFTTRGVPVIDYLGTAYGLTKDEVYDAMSKGKISGKEAQQIIIMGMEEDPRFAGAAEALMNTLAGTQSALDSQYEGVKRRMGQGYESVMIDANKEELNTLEGGMGDALGDALELAGKGEGEREALKRKYLADTRNIVLAGVDVSTWFADKRAEATDPKEQEAWDKQIEFLADAQARYQEASKNDDGMAAKAILEGIEAFAAESFLNDPQMLLYQDSQKKTAEKIQEIVGMAEEHLAGILGYQETISKGLSEGLSGAISSYFSGLTEGGLTPAENEGPDDDRPPMFGRKVERSSPGLTPAPYTPPDPDRTPMFGGDAWGLPYVPYDDYPTRLHEGERVLTAQEARQYQGGGGNPINISIGGMTVREEADIDRIARALADKLARARLVT